MKKRDIIQCFKCNIPLFNGKVGDICPSCKKRAEQDEIDAIERYDDENNIIS